MSPFRRKQPPASPLPEHAVIARFSLSDDTFGSPTESRFVAFEDSLAQAIDAAGVGERRNLFGNGGVVLYAYGPPTSTASSQ